MLNSNASTAAARHERNRQAGLALQREGRFFQAIEAYDAVLREQSEDWEVAHMRAVTLYQLGLMDESRAAFAALLSTSAVHFPGFWSNLGLLLASICPNHLSSFLQNKLVEYRCMHPAFTGAKANKDQRSQTPPPKLPTVSVVMPAYMHARYISEAIASVFAQTRHPLELIVIDDGSIDGTVEHCRAALVAAPFPVTFIARENRGAAATLNQGIALAKGDFIQLLNSDDRLPAERIATMLPMLLESNADWGYARVSYIDTHGQPLGHLADARVATLMAAQNATVMSCTLGLAMLRANSAISSGNLMFRKRLWETLGGFRDYRYNHDWDFCLRATLQCEPVSVPHPLYEYRIHDRNTITEAAGAPRMEHGKVMAAFVSLAQNQPTWPNPFAPTFANWGGEFLALLGATDALQHLPIELIEQALHVPLSLTPSNRIGEESCEFL
ncbi:glycosyltransferase family 2 protein [Candidatus Nitrotoga sp. 1052]|uniref:glycosyltransferase family 2 protein n=1 Tax=Candidatus Nitrotoga sp. 1052 TaxID=2886964 RepID=UPI001EF437E4|nr:glycosyltransferase [Candidatus Nitrotoga sp. 1052]